ncbi:hypothetical protein GCM10007916_28270 [Psychromonas marina]|uniref:Beta-xylanase n=1 Tax=Psychromonas marina TaxID=88364 RepID=A0ABQ6E2Z1_9GAMM|nr:endo-1,4-beta-xylanase [Psychromonas marina]GLS91757.1 hypothetical protein GCM10007916_28270 [Psychromonas marina]
MNNIEKTLLLLGTGIALNGCFSGELPDEQKNSPPAIEAPEVASLFELAAFPIGVATAAGDDPKSILKSDKVQELVKQHFNQITAENIMKPQYLQPTEGSFYFEQADALIDFAESNDISVHGHTLVWHHQSPQWMQDCATVAECTNFMEDHITTVVQHFAPKIDTWDVVNEAFHEDGSYRNQQKDWEGGSFWYQMLGESYIATAFKAARAADDDIELYYNDFNIEMNGAKLEAVLDMVKGFQADSTPIDGIGFQMHIKSDFPSLENITSALEKAVATGLKVKITELDIRINEGAKSSVLTTQLAESQKQRYKEVIDAYLEVVPAAQRGGVSVWGVKDSDSWIIDLYGNIDWPLLFDNDLNQKPALEGVAEALAADPTSPVVPGEDTLFKDDFSGDFNWYLKDQEWQSNVSGTFVHNTTEQTMDIDVDWGSESDQFDIAVAFPEGTVIDITDGVTVVLKVKLPAANVSDKNVKFQLYFESGDYQPAYFGYQQALTADGWTTLTIEDLSVSTAYNYISDTFDFEDVNAIGLQIQSEGSTPTTGTIQVGEIYIAE